MLTGRETLTNMAKRYRLPPMNRSSSLTRIAKNDWAGSPGSVKAIWVLAEATEDAAMISRASRCMSILPDKSFPQLNFHLQPSKKL